MTRQVWIFALSLVLLLAVLVVLSNRMPPEQGPDMLSVLVLRPGEGSAVIVACGGQTLLLPLGDGEDLTDYLNRQRLLQIEHVVTAERETVSLSDAVCEVEQTGNGAWRLSVTHADNRLWLHISPDASPELLMNHEPSILLETDRRSFRIFSDGSRVSVLPDFSAWAD